MSDSGQRRIRARRIQAENVVVGLQYHGTDSDPSEILAVARTVANGDIDADTIEALNIVSGVQSFLLRGKSGSSEDIKNELTTAQTLLSELTSSEPELLSKNNAIDIDDSLEDAKNELDEPEPDGSRLLRKVKEARDIVVSSAEAADAAGNLTTRLSALALQVAGLWAIVQQAFPI